MKIISTNLPEVMIIEPRVFEDNRGFFYESFNRDRFQQQLDIDFDFVQDNQSGSAKDVLRGLHYQLRNPQGKLVRVVNGTVLDVAVDMRRSSNNFGRWTSVVLSAANKRQLWIPPGFAHGLFVLSDWADFLYKTTDYYVPDDEYCVLWNDPVLKINWGNEISNPNVSAKDGAGYKFLDAPSYS